MPLYEYECTACHRRTEKIQKFSDPELTVCPHCGGPLERTVTAPSFQFAGGGWYKDGYGSVKPATASGESGTAPGTASPAAAPAGDSSAATASAAPSSAPATSSAAPAAAPARLNLSHVGKAHDGSLSFPLSKPVRPEI